MLFIHKYMKIFWHLLDWLTGFLYKQPHVDFCYGCPQSTAGVRVIGYEKHQQICLLQLSGKNSLVHRVPALKVSVAFAHENFFCCLSRSRTGAAQFRTLEAHIKISLHIYLGKLQLKKKFKKIQYPFSNSISNWCYHISKTHQLVISCTFTRQIQFLHFNTVPQHN